jgi:hypothetical protein
MDPDDYELIRRLCTKAGTIMEDASAVAITASGYMPDCIEATLAELNHGAIKIMALIAAARAVARSND